MSTAALESPSTPASTIDPPTPTPAADSPAPPSRDPDLTTPERDDLGFSRTDDQATPLDALWRLLNGFTDHDTPESETARRAVEKFNAKAKPKDRLPVIPGIAEGSQAWHDAHTARITLCLVPAPPPPPQPDLFSTLPRDVDRYAISEEVLCEPISYGGDSLYPEEVIGEYGMLEHWTAFAWDHERILITCPRGVCLVPRRRWAEGWRCCPAC